MERGSGEYTSMTGVRRLNVSQSSMLSKHRQSSNAVAMDAEEYVTTMPVAGIAEEEDEDFFLKSSSQFSETSSIAGLSRQFGRADIYEQYSNTSLLDDMLLISSSSLGDDRSSMRGIAPFHQPQEENFARKKPKCESGLHLTTPTDTTIGANNSSTFPADYYFGVAPVTGIENGGAEAKSPAALGDYRPMDYDFDIMQHSTSGSIAKSSLKTLICQFCNNPLSFGIGGDVLKCSTFRCSSHGIPVTDATVTSLPFEVEVFFTATFAHMTASKPNQALKKQGDIFGKNKAPIIDGKIIDYIRNCIVHSTKKTKASEITIDEVFACVKMHSWRDFYNDKLVHVFCLVTGRPLPMLSQLSLEKVRDFFRLARDAFKSSLVPKMGKLAEMEFLEPFFAWLKIIELVGATSVIPYIQRKLDEEQTAVHNAAWKVICPLNNWLYMHTPYIPVTPILPLTEYIVNQSDGSRFIPLGTSPSGGPTNGDDEFVDRRNAKRLSISTTAAKPASMDTVLMAKQEAVETGLKTKRSVHRKKKQGLFMRQLQHDDNAMEGDDPEIYEQMVQEMQYDSDRDEKMRVESIEIDFSELDDYEDIHGEMKQISEQVYKEMRASSTLPQGQGTAHSKKRAANIKARKNKGIVSVKTAHGSF